jgi:hypothetical protein
MLACREKYINDYEEQYLLKISAGKKFLLQFISICCHYFTLYSVQWLDTETARKKLPWIYCGTILICLVRLGKKMKNFN